MTCLTVPGTVGPADSCQFLSPVSCRRPNRKRSKCYNPLPLSVCQLFSPVTTMCSYCGRILGCGRSPDWQPCILVTRINFSYLLVVTFLSFFLSHSDPFVPTHCRCKMFLLHLTTLNDRHTFGRTSLDEWPARRKDLYLTTQTYNRQTSMPPARFEPAVPPSERPVTDAASTYFLALWIILGGTSLCDVSVWRNHNSQSCIYFYSVTSSVFIAVFNQSSFWSAVSLPLKRIPFHKTVRSALLGSDAAISKLHSADVSKPETRTVSPNYPDEWRW